MVGILIQPTSPLNNRDPTFAKSNFICLMCASPNLKPPDTLLSSRISWPSILCSTHSPFTLLTSGIPNHQVWATNSGYTKSRAHQEHCKHKPRAHTRPISCNIIPQKDTVIPYMARPHYPLNSQVLAIFFPSAAMATAPHYPELLIDILHSMVGYRFHSIS